MGCYRIHAPPSCSGIRHWRWRRNEEDVDHWAARRPDYLGFVAGTPPHDDDRPWWAVADVADDIQVSLDHVNQAHERPSLNAKRPRWELDVCGDLFNALNRLWTTRANLLSDQSLSRAPAPRQLTKLLKELTESDRLTLLGMPSIEALANFEPTIYDHSVVGRTRRIADITPQAREESEADHRHFQEDWARWRDRGSGVSRTLESLSRAVLVVRNNLAHGEKTLVGPDHDRADRNQKVASVVLGVLEDLVDFILGRPSQKLAMYGTLRPAKPRDTEGHRRLVGNRLAERCAYRERPTHVFLLDQRQGSGGGTTHLRRTR